MFARLLVIVSMLFSCTSYAEPRGGSKVRIPEIDPRLLYLDGIITDDTIAPLQEALDKVIAVGEDRRAPVTIVINSPGGGVIAGMSFVNKMATIQQLGVEINCYVTDVAASMAFQILTQCNYRYALPTSFLLWHGVRMGTRAPITVALARQIADDLEHMDALVMNQLRSTLNLSESTLRKHFDNETLWSGLGLHAADSDFLTLMQGYPRLLPRLNQSIRTAPMSFGFFGQLDGYQYIWSSWVLRDSGVEQ